MRLHSIRPIHWYVAVVSATGLALAVVLPATQGLSHIQSAPGQFWLFVAFLVLGEMVPVKVPRWNEDVEISTAATFGFALLVGFGPAAAALAHGLATLVADLTRRKPWWKAGFNASQYAVSVAAAGAVLALSGVPHEGMPPAFGPADIPGILAAGAVFFLVNHTLTQVAIALAQGLAIVPNIRSDFAFQASTAFLMLFLSPIAVVAAEQSLWLVPLLALPMLSVYRSTTVWLEKQYKEHQALHDPLTGLPNRRLIHDRIRQAIMGGRRSGRPLAVMLIDLDRFKEINDTLGHRTGDIVLREIGGRLAGLLRETDTIARLGGDEFAVLLPEVPDVAAAIQVADKILKALEAPFVLDGLSLDVDASIGIALYPDHGLDVHTLMQRADIAMYVAKEAHTSCELYTAERDRNSTRRLALLGELRRAIDRGQFLLHYQPKIDMRTRRVAGVEALVRWQHPRHGLMQPDEFIPLAEHTGLIKPLTLHVVDRALAQCRQWQSMGLEVPVAVNLSVRNLQDVNFPEEVGELLQKHEVHPELLELEITESAIVVDPTRALAVLGKLTGMGVRLSLDDFGTGYTSLASLKRLPVRQVKIDKSFIVNMVVDHDDDIIVRSTIELARNLGLQVVAEGVETEDIFERLAGLGCDLAQGYYLREPVSAAELTNWLAALNGPGDTNGHTAGNGQVPTAPELLPLTGADGSGNGKGKKGNGRARGNGHAPAHEENRTKAR
jgi:diguanylate cyclase (GGDEF)-like protein